MARSRNRPSSKAAETAPASRPATIDTLDPGDAVLREFIADFNAAMSLMRNLRRTLAAIAELSATEYMVLLGLWYCARQGKTNVRDLAEHLHLAPAHVTAEIGQLVAAGLVTKKIDLNDKRAVEINLSRNGHALLDRLATVFGEVNLVLFAGVPYPDMVIVHRFLKRVIDQAPEAIRIAERFMPADDAAQAAPSRGDPARKRPPRR